MTDLGKPYADRPLAEGGRRSRGADGQPRRVGRTGRIALQIFGSQGAIVSDREGMNEFQIYRAAGPRSARTAEQGFATALAGPRHRPYDRFVPAPGHSLGSNDLKVVECRELMATIAGEPFRAVDFSQGLRIERSVHAMAKPYQGRRWVDVAVL